jgi:hypothetical protein
MILGQFHPPPILTTYFPKPGHDPEAVPPTSHKTTYFPKPGHDPGAFHPPPTKQPISLSLDMILGQFHPTPILTTYFPKPHFTVNLPSQSRCSKWPLSRSFRTKILYAFIVCHIRACVRPSPTLSFLSTLRKP